MSFAQRSFAMRKSKMIACETFHAYKLTKFDFAKFRFCENNNLIVYIFNLKIFNLT